MEDFSDDEVVDMIDDEEDGHASSSNNKKRNRHSETQSSSEEDAWSNLSEDEYLDLDASMGKETQTTNHVLVTTGDPYFHSMDMIPTYRHAIRNDIVGHHEWPNGVPLPCRLHGGAPINTPPIVIPQGWDPFLQEFINCIGYFRFPACALRFIQECEVGNKKVLRMFLSRWCQLRFGMNIATLVAAPPSQCIYPYGTIPVDQCCKASDEYANVLPVRYSMAPIVEEVYHVEKTKSTQVIDTAQSTTPDNTPHSTPNRNTMTIASEQLWVKSCMPWRTENDMLMDQFKRASSSK